MLSTYGLAAQGSSRFAFALIVGRELGVQPLGAVTALLAIGVFTSLLWPTSAGFVASLHLARGSGASGNETIARLNRQVLLSLAVIAAVTSLVGLTVTRSPWLVSGGAGAAVAYSAYMYARSAQLGLHQAGRVAVWDTVCGVTILGGGLLAAGYAPSFILFPLAVGYGLFAMICWPRTAGAPRSQSRQVGRLVAANALAQLAGGGLVNLTMLTAHFFGNPHSAGVFAAAFSLATPSLMLGQSLQQVLIPHFARDHDEVAVRSDLRQVLLRLGTALAGLFIVVILVAGWLLELLFGSVFQEGAGALRGLLVGVLIASLSLIPAAALIARKRSRDLVRATLAGFAVGLTLMVGLGPTLSTWAPVIGYAVGSGLTGILWMRAILR